MARNVNSVHLILTATVQLIGQQQQQSACLDLNVFVCRMCFVRCCTYLPRMKLRPMLFASIRPNEINVFHSLAVTLCHSNLL